MNYYEKSTQSLHFSVYENIFPMALSRPALVGVDEIDASAVVETLDIGALIDVDLAVNTAISGFALALVHVHAIQTVGAVLAWVRCTFVDVCTGEHLLMNKDSECHQN